MVGVGIYALDLNSTVGFAIERQGLPPIFGSQYFARAKANQTGAQGLAFMKWLRAELEFYRPERLIFEAPLPPIRQSQTTTATVTIGFAYVTEIVCCAMAVPVSMVHAATYCKFFTGSGKRDKDTKARVLVECARRGWDVPDDNSADAVGILAYAIGTYHPNDAVRNRAIGNRVAA